LSWRLAMVLLCATFLAACDGCHERRRICLAPSSDDVAWPLEAPAAAKETAGVPARGIVGA